MPVDAQCTRSDDLRRNNSQSVLTTQGSFKSQMGVPDGSQTNEFESETNISPVICSSQHYVEEWEKLFKCPNYATVLKQIGVDGILRSSRFRSVCWRVYLECLSEDQTLWLKETLNARERYNKLKEQFLTNPRKNFDQDLLQNNPLSQDENSPWNQYFQDVELKVTIRQDVIRTFPEIEFFHSRDIRDMMVNILFCYARMYPQMLYKQGMHELLAPLIFVLHSDHQAFLHASEIELVESFHHLDRKTVKTLLDPEYIEHDAFFMFSQVMEVVEPWYIVKEIYPAKSDTINMRPFARPQDLHPTNVIIFKLTRIHDQLLKRHDPELFHHLERLEIAPQMYGIRWLRLLFGREFPLQDLLVIWDVIFADSMAFDLVDYTFIAMLVYIRELLLNSDYATCLSFLMRYPAITDIQYIIAMALHMRDPQHHSKPSGHSLQMLQHVPTVGGRADIHRAPIRNNSTESLKEQSKTAVVQKSGNKMMTGFSSLTRKMASRPRSLAVNQDLLKTGRASSEPTTFESRSPSPTLPEYCQGKHEQKYADSAVIGSIPLETELQTMTNKPSFRYKGDFEQSYGSEEALSGSPGKNLQRKGSWSFKRNKEVKGKEEIADATYLLGRLNDIQAMCTCCSQKMTLHLDRLQECLLRQALQNEDDMLIALAGLKQVRDILKGTLKFSQNLLDGDDIVISDNHYPQESKETNNTNGVNATELQDIGPSVSQNYESFQDVDLDSTEYVQP